MNANIRDLFLSFVKFSSHYCEFNLSEYLGIYVLQTHRINNKVLPSFYKLTQIMN